jgi:KaiC/GvpD/RAD55 family RecA-like ATPase
MFKETIPGLNKIFETDIPTGGIIIVTGTAGSLKSAFIYNLISEYLKLNKGKSGIYVTLEETKKSYLKNMKSLGISLEPRLKVSDIASFREHIGFEDMDYLDLILQRISNALGNSSEPSQINNHITKESDPTRKIKPRKISCFALDSLNALYSLINLDKHKMRNKLLEFFAILRKKNLTSFIVLEMSKERSYSEEFFLADGIIEFGITTSPEKSLKRYIQVKKMRATKHSLDPFVIEVGKKGLKVVGKLLT